MGNIITTLPAWCIEAASASTGFAASIIRRDTMTAKTSAAFPTFRRGIVINSSFPVVADMSFGAMITNDKSAEIIAGACCEIAVNAYKIEGSAPIEVLPELSTLQRVWSETKILPYDSNLYTAKLSDKYEISLATGIYVVVLDILDTVDIPGLEDSRRLNIKQSVNISGVPADTQQEFYVNLDSSFASIIARLDSIHDELAGM